MRLFGILLALCALASPCLSQEAPSNRLWWAEFELSGPLDGLRVECGVDGWMRLQLDLLPGEKRSLALPLPMYSPLGSAGLGEIPIELKASGAGDARFVAWSSPQPNRRFELLAPGLRARSRPPAGPGQVRLGAAALALFLASLILVWAARSRPVAMLLLGLLAACGLGWMAAGRSQGAGGFRLLELDLESESGFEARSAWTRLELPKERLELMQGDRPLGFELRLSAGQLSGEVLAQDRVLVAQKLVNCPPYGGQSNPGADLSEVWIRTADGVWSYHGAWASGAALGPRGPEPGAPPSWLLSGLPAARGVLLGRFGASAGHWIRALGFNPR